MTVALQRAPADQRPYRASHRRRRRFSLAFRPLEDSWWTCTGWVLCAPGEDWELFGRLRQPWD